MSDPQIDDTLESDDSDFHSPLSRIHYAPGMLLGVDATRAEQRYHRQRLNRHHYWVHGAGTVVGLAVTMSYQESADFDNDMKVDLIVSPGVGVDRLGREVFSGEPYCVDLQDWFQAQLDTSEGQSLLQDGLEADGETLSLMITMRYQGCASGLQPVMAHKVNAGTDPVDASRVQDCLLLEIIPGVPPVRDEDWFWPGHERETSTEDPLNEHEKTFLDTLSGDEQRLRSLQARLVYAMPNHNRALEVHEDSEILARTLLAQVRIPVRVDALPELSPIINYHRIEINNLVRPFVTTTDQLARLTRQE